MKMGEGRNPEEELRGWENPKKAEKDLLSDWETCHISHQPLVLIGKTSKNGLSVYASVADGRPDKKEGILTHYAKTNNKSLSDDEEPPLATG